MTNCDKAKSGESAKVGSNTKNKTVHRPPTFPKLEEKIANLKKGKKTKKIYEKL